MASIFTKRDDHLSKPNRNTFNRSFTNNLTLPIGKYVPCFCKEVISDQSVRIKPTFGFNLMPLVTPVQSRIRMNLHFFYVRNRPLWRGWMDFYGDTENPDNDTEPPYIKFTEDNKDRLKSGDILDYIGLPNSFYNLQDQTRNPALYSTNTGTSDDFRYEGFILLNNYELKGFYIPDLFQIGLDDDERLLFAQTLVNNIDTSIQSNLLEPLGIGYVPYRSRVNFNTLLNLPVNYVDVDTYIKDEVDLTNNYPFSYMDNYYGCIVILRDITDNKILGYAYGTQQQYIDAPVFFTSFYNCYQHNSKIRFDIPTESLYHECEIIVLTNLSTEGDNEEVMYFEESAPGVLAYHGDNHLISATLLQTQSIDYSLLPLSSSNYYSDENPDGIKVSSLPLRAYESIYNSFYRDDRNNPLVYNGKEIYNRYIPSDVGGEDTHIPEFFNANWMPDVFTTAVQSPQQGVMPLVGVTATGRMTFQDDNGKTYYLNANLNSEGELTGIDSYSSDMPVGTLHSMVDLISTGISINDFRNVNALQRWLEKNMRRGYHYADIIKSHFGNDIAYKDANLPEFIGGISRVVDINKVVATAETEIPLGSIAGIGNVFGDTDAYVSHFCDEPGWIIGIISVTPEPAYSQLLDKQLLKRSLLDYYFPEFAHIGFQPILNQELTPLQCRDVVGKRLTDVFGYQRAWYEYLTANDEIHGEYRTTMRNYVIQRLFKDVPELSEQFLTIDKNVANSVFADNNDSDKIFGQIYFDFVTKLPMPKYGIPRLEA